MVDVVQYEPKPSSGYLLCGGFFQGVYFEGSQGISVGWADEYETDLDGQFIDITKLPSGNYVLEMEVNAEWLYKEADYTNNRSAVTVQI